jgi:RHS repeat-associated protein
MRWTSRITSKWGLLGLELSACLVATTGFSQTAPSAYTTGYRYSTGGLLTGVIQPYTGTGTVSYLATRNTYNSGGLVSTVEKGALAAWQSQSVAAASWPNFTVFQTETFGYDSMGRLLWKQLSSAGIAYTMIQYSYDSMGRQQCVATRMNPSQYGSMPAACTLATQGSYGPDRVTNTTYNAQSRPLTIRRAYGTSLQQTYATCTYTPNGLPQTIKDANGNLTTQSYDGLDRLSKMQFPSKTTAGTSSTTDIEQYTYDNNGNRKTLLTRDSQAITYSYDALNRLTLKQWPTSWGVSVYYAYDLRNLRLYANYGSATGRGVSNTYDGFGHMRSETANLSGAAQQISYQYDADGNRTQVTYPDGNYIKYGYDGLDRLTQILENGSSTLAAYSYDSQGRLQQITRGGGVTMTGFGYDTVSRLNSQSHTLATSHDNVSFSFADNPANQIVSQGISNAEYDSLATSTTQSYSVNGLNEYSAVGGVSFSWDPRANLTSDGSTTYAYDLENHLTAANGAYNVSLSYDPLGRLYQTTSGSATTDFVYDGDRIAVEYDGSGNLLRRYAYGPGGDDPLVWYEGSAVGQSNRRYLHSDHEGSIIAVTDGTGGTLAVNRYDPYGIRGSSNLGRFQFTGQAHVPELGLYYYKARMYNAALGRFMQTDPIGYKDDLDLYTYVGNDPLDRTDPSGDYGQGEGWTDEMWKNFDKIQQKAAGDMEKRAGKLEAKADKLDAKGKSGGSDLRSEAGSLRQGAAALRSDGSDGKVANAVDSKTYESMGGSKDGAAFVKDKGPVMTVNVDNKAAWNSGNRMSEWVVGHESLHTAGLDDQVGPNGQKAYRFGEPPQRDAFWAIRGTPTAVINPDSIMYLVY